MTETERGSDELLGAEAIDKEQGRMFVEELVLGQEEVATRKTEPEVDEDTEFDDVAPPAAEAHVEYNELPPPVQEI